MFRIAQDVIPIIGWNLEVVYIEGLFFVVHVTQI